MHQVARETDEDEGQGPSPAALFSNPSTHAHTAKNQREDAHKIDETQHQGGAPEQREAEQEEGSEGREEGQDSPIACGDDIHLYDNQISPGPGQYIKRGNKREGERGQPR